MSERVHVLQLPCGKLTTADRTPLEQIISQSRENLYANQVYVIRAVKKMNLILMSISFTFAHAKINKTATCLEILCAVAFFILLFLYFKSVGL